MAEGMWLTRAAAAATVAGIGLVLAGCAAKEPVVGVIHAQGEYSAPVEVDVAGSEGVTVTFREITIAPGAGTGKHCHAGQLIGVVHRGTLTHYADIYPGGVHVYEEGDAIVEGAGYVHEGVNEGDTDVVLWVAYVIPEGEPLAQTGLAKCDA